MLTCATLVLLMSTTSATPTKSYGHGIVNVVQTLTGIQITKNPEYLEKDVYVSFQCTEGGKGEKLIPAGTRMTEVVGNCRFIDADVRD